MILPEKRLTRRVELKWVAFNAASVLALSIYDDVSASSRRMMSPSEQLDEWTDTSDSKESIPDLSMSQFNST